MKAFLKVFGSLKVTDVAIFLAAIIFFIKILRCVKKYLKQKAEEAISHEQEYKKLLDKVDQYPNKIQQVIDKQDDLDSALIRLSNKLDETNDKLSMLKLTSDRNEATSSRFKIIRFNDEILKQEKHTREHFDQILEAIDAYEHYCKIDTDYRNSKASFAISNIKRAYTECMNNNSFL